MAEDYDSKYGARLERVEKKVDILVGDVEVLKADFKVIKGDVEVLKSDVKGLRGDVNSLQDVFSFMLKKMDENQEQTERYFHMILERNREDLAGLSDATFQSIH